MSGISWLSQSQWEKLLLRWSGMEPIGEVKLVCAVIASAIAEEPRPKDAMRAPYRSGFFDGPISAWCALIGLDWKFVIEQADRLCSFQGGAKPVSYRGETYGEAAVFETSEGASFAWRRPNGTVEFKEFESLKDCRKGLQESVASHAKKHRQRKAGTVAEAA